jgi:serine/threonine protein kinase
VTRDSKSNEYAIVTEFYGGGSLREVIKKKHSILNWVMIIFMLRCISYGLVTIHTENYYHRDFHSGNILNEVLPKTVSKSVISDFGLCCPANQSSVDKTLYGVLPFVAPEVLRGEEFTEAADIYGFGVLMSEVISGKPPFFDRDFDLHLALDVCNGLRPQIPEYAPEPYVTLMKCCWDPIPTNRPNAWELFSKFHDWCEIISDSLDKSYNKDIKNREQQEIEEAFSQEREDKWKTQLAELATNPQPLKKSQNLLTSKQLDYSKQLSQLLKTKSVKIVMNDDGMLFYLNDIF